MLAMKWYKIICRQVDLMMHIVNPKTVSKKQKITLKPRKEIKDRTKGTQVPQQRQEKKRELIERMKNQQQYNTLETDYVDIYINYICSKASD